MPTNAWKLKTCVTAVALSAMLSLGITLADDSPPAGVVRISDTVSVPLPAVSDWRDADTTPTDADFDVSAYENGPIIRGQSHEETGTVRIITLGEVFNHLHHEPDYSWMNKVACNSRLLKWWNGQLTMFYIRNRHTSDQLGRAFFGEHYGRRKVRRASYRSRHYQTANTSVTHEAYTPQAAGTPYATSGSTGYHWSTGHRWSNRHHRHGSDCQHGCNWQCKWGYFLPTGGSGVGVSPFGTYGAAYPLNPHYYDRRDAGVYAAQGYGTPVTVPLAPNVHQSYNFGWGIPSSRLTPISRSVR